VAPLCPSSWYGNTVPLWLVVLLVILATHRVTRLISSDAIPLVAVPREAFVRRWGVYADAPPEERSRVSMNGRRTNVVMRSLAYLWECPWCVSMYVGAGISYAAWTWTPLGDQHWLITVLLAFSSSGVTGLIAEREKD